MSAGRRGGTSMTVAISPIAPRLIRTSTRTMGPRTASGWISSSRPPGRANRWSMPTGIRVSKALTGSYWEYWNTFRSRGTHSSSRTGRPHPLWRSAGGTPRPVSAERDPDGLHDVRIVGFEDRGDDLWIDVEVLSASACTSNDPRVVAKGWLRAHAASGEPVVWFFARGC